MVDGIYYVEEYSASGRVASSVQEYISNRVPVEVQVSALGINSFENSGLVIYPNPSKGIFTIKSDIGVLQISIYNILGKQIDHRTIVITSYSIHYTKLYEFKI